MTMGEIQNATQALRRTLISAHEMDASRQIVITDCLCDLVGEMAIDLKRMADAMEVLVTVASKGGLDGPGL